MHTFIYLNLSDAHCCYRGHVKYSDAESSLEVAAGNPSLVESSSSSSSSKHRTCERGVDCNISSFGGGGAISCLNRGTYNSLSPTATHNCSLAESAVYI